MLTVTAGSITLRPMTTDDLGQACALSAALRWPHRIQDWFGLFDLGLGFVAERNGAVVGSIMLWPFGETAARLGLVIVANHLQGQGIGHRLMMAALDAAGERSVALCATEEGRPLYEKLGFRALACIDQHQGSCHSVAAFLPTASDHIRRMRAEDIQHLVDIDQAVTGLDRWPLYASLLIDAEGLVVEDDGRIAGFAIVRQFGYGFSIGPVIAAAPEVAKNLIAHALAGKPGQFLRLDVPHDAGLSEWLERCGVPQVGSVTTMLRGEAPVTEGPLTQFAIVSQALG